MHTRTHTRTRTDTGTGTRKATRRSPSPSPTHTYMRMRARTTTLPIASAMVAERPSTRPTTIAPLRLPLRPTTPVRPARARTRTLTHLLSSRPRRLPTRRLATRLRPRRRRRRHQVRTPQFTLAGDTVSLPTTCSCPHKNIRTCALMCKLASLEYISLHFHLSSACASEQEGGSLLIVLIISYNLSMKASKRGTGGDKGKGDHDNGYNRI